MLLSQKSDALGALSSGLCLIHCVFTPFLFVIQAHGVCCEGTTAPFWWKSIDYIFLVISFFAIFKSASQTSKEWMKYALFSSWVLLAFIIINEKIALFAIPEAAMYVVSLSLVGLHLYNSKYCQCSNETCCTVS
ncbi:MerC domain-containing protein [uncultured Tenacibaculum sp.]|uniref:MerC domain-containing protein n=1 Tax=uncultured Tenacibaculum sp. TaxID=174713 RepID=UPI002606C512|nr:MerC domain-containing protein [uncultured Tenacibaculum sp.]